MVLDEEKKAKKLAKKMKKEKKLASVSAQQILFPHTKLCGERLSHAVHIVQFLDWLYCRWCVLLAHFVSATMTIGTTPSSFRARRDRESFN
jgi:hypothetical protein